MKMKFAKWTVFLFLFSACAMGTSYENEIAQLTTLLTEVRNSKEVFDSIDSAQISAVAKESKTQMDSFNKQYKGELTKDQARIVNEFNNVKRLLKDFDRQKKRVSDEYLRTESQLTALISTLKEGNNVDASGNQIDQTYVTKQIGVETKVAQSLIQEVDELNKRCDTALENFEIAKPAMENLLNELLP